MLSSIIHGRDENQNNFMKRSNLKNNLLERIMGVRAISWGFRKKQQVTIQQHKQFELNQSPNEKLFILLSMDVASILRQLLFCQDQNQALASKRR